MNDQKRVKAEEMCTKKYMKKCMRNVMKETVYEC